MSNQKSTRDAVCQILGDRLSRDWRSLKDLDRLAVELGADSLDLAEISMDLEDAFGLPYRTFDHEPYPRTIGEIVASVDVALARKSAAQP